MHITVYAASSGQVPERYWQAAHQLGHCLAAHGHTLVNGAGRTGLMGATIDGILAAGGRAVGVIPQFMIDEHWEHPDMAEMIVTPDMHSRQERMAEMADACIACPGGVGTLEELLEVITWKQLGLFLHPIVAEHRRLFRSAPRPTGALRRTTVHASHTHGHLAGGVHARRGRALVRRNAALGCQCAPFCRALNGGALLCPPLF